MTQEQLIEKIRAMADKDGVVSLKKDSNERYYLEKIVGKSDGLLMNEWIKQNVGLVMYVKGKNDSEVILHRLRKNGLLHTNKTKNGIKETLYASDLIVDKTDQTILGLLKTKIRKQIKEQASAKHMSAEEYVVQYVGIDYVPKNKMLIRGFSDVDKWIEQNIVESDADTLRQVEGFVNVRNWLKNNWKIQNKEIVSAFVDYVICKYPEYHISAQTKLEDKSEFLKNILLEMYPDKVVSNLKSKSLKVYNLIYSYRREIPNGHTMSMKEMIEDYIGKGELTYITEVNTHVSKYNNNTIKVMLQNMFGAGDTRNPVVIKISENGAIDKNKRRVMQALRVLCKSNEIDMQEYLAGEGYVQYKYLNTKAKPAKKPSKNKHKNNRNTIKLTYGSRSESKEMI